MKILSEATFETLAGEKTYQRGLDYYNEGRVSALSINGTRITAQVEGSQPYQVELHHTKKVFEGTCACPASDNFDFCKHCVAVALSYYYQTQTNQEIGDSSESDLVLNYLGTLTKPHLVEELHKLIKRDSSVQDHWLLKAEVSSGKLNASDLRKRITKAIPYKPSGLWRYNDVAVYFSDSLSALSPLKDPILSLDSQSAIKLVIYAIERLEKTLETIDDSNGYRIPLEINLEEWFNTALSQTDWSLKQKTTFLSDLILSEKFTYDLLNLPTSIQSDENQALLDAIYKNLNAVWAKLTPPTNTSSSTSTAQSSNNSQLYSRLKTILIDQALNDNNVDRELEILTKDATGVKQCISLIKRCLEHNRLDTANEWLNYVSRAETLNPHDVVAIENIQILIWLAEQKFDNALAAQWAIFEEDEQLLSFQAALETAKKINQESKTLEQGIAYLNRRISTKQKTKRNNQRVEALAEIYLNYNMAHKAISLAKQHKLKPGTLMAIVNALPKLEASSARIMERATNILASLNSSETNDRAIAFLQKVENKLDTQQQKLFRTSVLNIYAENKRKSQFIKKLKNAFAFI